MIASAREHYAHGRIDEAELDRRIEQQLLREAGRGHPIPDGWQPLQPCEHEWLEVTRLGEAERHLLCGRCGDESFESLPAVSSGL